MESVAENEKTVYWTGLLDDDLGEMDVFFDKNGLIHWWHCNDASYRSEYMNPLMRALGVQMVYVEKLPPKVYKALKKFF